jgi:hypothetical protein
VVVSVGSVVSLGLLVSGGVVLSVGVGVPVSGGDVSGGLELSELLGAVEMLAVDDGSEEVPAVVEPVLPGEVEPTVEGIGEFGLKVASGVGWAPVEPGCPVGTAELLLAPDVSAPLPAVSPAAMPPAEVASITIDARGLESGVEPVPAVLAESPLLIPTAAAVMAQQSTTAELTVTSIRVRQRGRIA